MLSIKENKKSIDLRYIYLALIFLGSLFIYQIVGMLETYIYSVLGNVTFLTYHLILESLSIIISFTSFILTYYTYQKNNRLRLLVYSAVFFITGWLDFFHTMGYNGMPVFFTNSSIPKATTFWIIGRLIFAMGLLVAGLVPYNYKTRLSRSYFLWGSIIVSVLISYVVTVHLDSFPPLFIEGQGLTELKINLEYFILVIFAIASILYIRDYHLTRDRVFMLVAAGLIVSVFAEAAFTVYKSVYDTYNMLGHIYKVLGLYLISRGIFIYNLDKPYVELSNAKKKIKLYAENLEKIVERRTSEVHKINAKMIEDLEYAKKIQESMLPAKELNIYSTQFVSEYIPCERLSGDFYGIYVIDEENLGMYIADVAGHGVSAAMMTVVADRIIKPTGAQERAVNALAPHKTLGHFYREFNKSEFPIEMHVVMFHAIFNTKSRLLSYCSGGINVLPILVRKSGEIVTLSESTGFPICRFGDFYTPEYKKADIQMEKGDRVIFYTDGLVENFKNSTLIEQKDLIRILLANRDKDLKVLSQGILNEIKQIASGSEYDDDITYFIMEA
ncbi:sigma-B regulation protein RsbU (phosphoserine phosphatase) [Anaerosolibacter carboniphilus]|uniref:Sigma-B regulation protein RsbU (Phosphoserine phosphatase) n=2 Tax=Anaerosolibacter carboniphilus TaxID=1417629 RepID=A0A841KLB5_9FIRM|nr:sigma-B regulation protein RsbU (phosphoserine phosphatase) [Anaerosolibacter carboniphilus]